MALSALFSYLRLGIKLAIISNQNGISSQFTTKKELQSKVDSIIESLGVPMDFICAVEDDGFKKPRTGDARQSVPQNAMGGVI